MAPLFKFLGRVADTYSRLFHGRRTVMKINQVNMGNNSPMTSGMETQMKVKEAQAISVQNQQRNRIEQKKPKQTEPLKEVMDDELLDKSIEQANKSLELYNRRIDRAIHEVTKTMMYTIRDTVTNEVIQEFPPKKIQDMIAKMWELAGLFVDEKA